jgi:hypothetical protein
MIVCLPKPGGSQRRTDFRPITLLNVDYKLLARIFAVPIRLLMAEHLQTYKFCGVPGNTIFEAVATVREAIAQTEVT